MDHSETTARDEERATLLRRINDMLAARGFKPFKRLGDAGKGEIEITSVRELVANASPDGSTVFWGYLALDVVFPGGKAGRFFPKFNGNGAVSDGAVMAVLINGKFAMVKQYRLTVQEQMIELPRGFGEKMDKAQIAGSLGTLKIGDLPLGTLTRELGEEVMSSAVVTSVTHLGNIAQDSGVDTATPAYYLVQLTVDEKVLAGKLQGTGDEVSKVLLWEPSKVKAELGRRIRDNHSITGLALAFNHIESLPRL